MFRNEIDLLLFLGFYILCGCCIWMFLLLIVRIGLWIFGFIDCDIGRYFERS